MTMKRPTGLPVLPVLASQCYSHGEDVDLDNNRHGREPLKESTGNAQHHHSHIQALVRSSSYDQRSEHQQHHHQHHVYPIPPTLSTPTLYLGQTLDFTPYGEAQYARSLFQQAHFQHQHTQGGGRRDLRQNPFWKCQEFQAYRKRQAERDDKTSQKWPEEFELAFLDAFLLMPQIRKMKYSLRGRLYGRNMLIGEYIWLDYVARLPPGVEPDPSEKRGRKQVSSHIQVVKGFLKDHPWFHIFFPIYQSKSKDKDRENLEKESFKNHPVLIALTEERLPDERPNYEYFDQILSRKNPVAIKPKRCWIFVSHRDVTVQEDGSGYINTTRDRLSKTEYPHLKLNLEREKWSKEEQQQIFKGALLHEFTKDLSQFESSTIREITDEWETVCPELHEKLEDIIATNPRCDILHIESMLELKEKRRFPGQSDLNSWVEITVDHPHLLNHRWKVETTLVRPPELSYSSDKSEPETVYHTSAKMGIQYQHRPGCEGHRGSGGEACDGRCRLNHLIVPFPADVFALTLTNCAEYPAHPSLEAIRRGLKRGPVVKNEDGEQDQEFRPSAAIGDQPTQMDLVPRIAMMQELWSCPPEDSTDLYGGGGDDSQGGEGRKKGPRWERRGILLWSFKTIHRIVFPTSKGGPPELKSAANGKTQWRFLQILDTSSQYHQSRALVKGDGSGIGGRPRDASGQPSRTNSFLLKHESRAPSPLATAYLQQPHSASTTDSFSTAASWDIHGGAGGPGSLSSLSSSATQVRAQAAYNTQLMLQTNHAGGLLDSFGGGPGGAGGGGGGLATPPPSASLASSFATSFESVANDATADQLTNYMAAHVSSASDMAHSQQTLSDLSAVTDPFLANSATSSFDTGAFDEGSAGHDDVSGWATTASGNTVPGANGGGWSTGYSSTTTPTGTGTNGSHHHHHHHPGANVMHWVHNSPSTAAAAAGSNSLGRHYSQHASTQPPQLHLQTQVHHHHHHGNHHHPHHWITSAATDPEETGFWTPATSTDDALTSGIDAREQIIWPVSAPSISIRASDPRHHNETGTGSGGDDWVHVQQQQQHQQHQQAAVASSEELPEEEQIIDEEEVLSSTSDLSQGWEEIVAASASAESQSQSQSQSQQSQASQFNSQSTISTATADDDLLTHSFPLSPLGSTAGHLHDNNNNNSFTVQQQQQQPRGQKRSRSDSTSRSGGYGHDEGIEQYHQHQQHLHRSSQRVRLSPS